MSAECLAGRPKRPADSAADGATSASPGRGTQGGPSTGGEAGGIVASGLPPPAGEAAASPPDATHGSGGYGPHPKRNVAWIVIPIAIAVLLVYRSTDWYQPPAIVQLDAVVRGLQFRTSGERSYFGGRYFLLEMNDMIDHLEWEYFRSVQYQPASGAADAVLALHAARDCRPLLSVTGGDLSLDVTFPDPPHAVDVLARAGHAPHLEMEFQPVTDNADALVWRARAHVTDSGTQALRLIVQGVQSVSSSPSPPVGEEWETPCGNVIDERVAPNSDLRIVGGAAPSTLRLRFKDDVLTERGALPADVIGLRVVVEGLPVSRVSFVRPGDLQRRSFLVSGELQFADRPDRVFIQAHDHLEIGAPGERMDIVFLYIDRVGRMRLRLFGEVSHVAHGPSAVLARNLLPSWPEKVVRHWLVEMLVGGSILTVVLPLLATCMRKWLTGSAPTVR